MSIVDVPVTAEKAERPESVWSKIAYHLAAHPLGLVGAAIMAVFVFCAVFADVITAYSPTATDSALRLLHPGSGHALGTDQMGRDIFSRIIYGARISLAVGLGSTFLGSFFGVALGLTSGYLGGWVDLVIQRIIDVLQSVPLLVLALVMAAALGPALDNTIVAIAIPLIPYTVARHPLQHAGAARAAFRGSGARRRHERVPHRRAPRAAEHASRR